MSYVFVCLLECGLERDPVWAVTASNGDNVDCILTSIEQEGSYCWHAGNGGNAGQEQTIDFDFGEEKSI